MASIVETKAATRAYKTCVKEKGSEACVSQRTEVVKGVSGAVKAECVAYTEDFFGCFMHRYRLNSCSDATVTNMLKCQQNLASTMLSAS
mmetsp:Transcript_70653/g.111636  ORF Transcript_70653/g.111636 Transcript_70653/m.111636 type:complete len:89 (-) Transcript_70653:56-322(-)